MDTEFDDDSVAMVCNFCTHVLQQAVCSVSTVCFQGIVNCVLSAASVLGMDKCVCVVNSQCARHG